MVVKVQGQELSFISPLVEEGIRQHLNIPEEQQISFTQLDTITKLDLSRRGITDIYDLVLMPKLRSLDLHDNRIEDLRPLTVLDSLEWVDLSYNGLKGINDLFYSSAKKVTVDVSFNYIKDFSLFTLISSCTFFLEGTGFQMNEEAPYYDVCHLFSYINEDEEPVVTYRGYSNISAASSVRWGNSYLSAQLDGDVHTEKLSIISSEAVKVALTNGEKEETTYLVPTKDYQVEAGGTVVMTTGLPDNYTLLNAYAKSGAVTIVGNTIEYKAPDKAVPDTVNFSYYLGSTVKGYSRFYVNRGKGNVETITIGTRNQLAYVGDKDLDFTDDAVKAYIVSGCEGTTIWLTRVMDVPAGTPVLLRGEAGDYDIPVTTSFTHYPENLLRGSATAASSVVPEENGYVNMYLSKKEGTFVKFASETTFPAGMSYLHMPVTSFAAPIAGDAQTIEIPSSGKYTYCPSVDLNFTNVDGGLKAYIATGFEKSGKLWLTKVNKVQAGTPLLLKGDEGSYSVSSVGSQTEFANLFKGSATESTSLSTTTGEYTNYYVNKSGAFLLFSETPVNYPAGRSYLQIPTAFLAGGSAGTRSVEPVGIDSEDAEVISMEVSFGDGTTGIKMIQQHSTGQNDVYYNLQGQRVDNPGKGLYIKNGKKVVIK